MKNAFGTRQLILCALFSALTAVCAQIQIPLIVPINLALLAVHLAGALLGAKYGGLSMVVYILLAAVGLPVLSGMSGGYGILFGKTGGYILGYVLDAALVGALCLKWARTYWKTCAAMALGTAACYFLGTLWFMWMTKLGLWASLVYCVFPFMIGDAAKIALAAYLTGKLRARLMKSRWAVG